MDTNWTKAEFKNYGKLQGALSELVQAANEGLARELGVNLSAFLRSSVTATYQGCGEIPFGEFPLAEAGCLGLALVRPGDRKLLLELEHAVLFPLVGIALGAKAGSFASPERKPTEIELQVVHLLFRLILADAYRSWSPLAKAPLETVTLEIEQAPARALPVAEPVFAAHFELAVGEQTGRLTLLAPPDLFASAMPVDDTLQREQPQTSASVQATLQRMLDGKVSLEVWLDGCQMRLGDLLQLREGQIVRLDHPVERRAVGAINGQTSFSGQIVSTGRRRAFQVEDFTA